MDWMLPNKFAESRAQDSIVDFRNETKRLGPPGSIEKLARLQIAYNIEIERMREFIRHFSVSKTETMQQCSHFGRVPLKHLLALAL